MISKFLEKTTVIIPQGLQEESENMLELEYYLVECCQDTEDNGTGYTGYGVEIVKKERGTITDKVCLADIFNSRLQSENLLRKLVIEKVTPLSLPYILDDILGI